MSEVAKLIADLIAAGTPGDLVGRVAAAIAQANSAPAPAVDEAAERRRAKDRARKALRNSAERSAENSAETVRNSAEFQPHASARVEDKTLLTEIEPQESKQESKTASRGDLAEFRDAFIDLDAGRLDALIKHRRAKRAQLTAHAARLFRLDVEKCGLSIADGVDMCISRNWITIKPDWLVDRNARGSPPRSGALVGVAALSADLRRRIAEDEQQGTTSEGGPDPQPALRLSVDRR